MIPCAFTDEVAPDFEEAVEACVAGGVRHVQVRNVGGKNVVHLPEQDVARLAGVARSHGVRIAGIGSPFGKCALDEDAWTAHAPLFDRIVRLAELFDTRLVRVFAFYAGQRRGPDGAPLALAGALPEVAQRLAGPVARAEREGLILGLENEYTTLAGSCRETRSVIDAVGSPALRCCWDVASGWYTGEPVLPDGYAAVRRQVCDVHVRDARPASDNPRRHGETCLLGQGAIDWPGVIRQLGADGYDGCLTLETHLYSGAPERWPKLKAATIHAMGTLHSLLASSALTSPD